MAVSVYSMNDSEWYAAETPQEALLEMAANLGVSLHELMEDFTIHSGGPQLLSDAQMQKMTIKEDEADENGESVIRTFKEHLEEMVTDGVKFPCFFASTEY